ncbi:MAG TPA: cysteine synthase family protein [Phycisphaerales bacterium]|nr:cysteine synthase family protein [Phycisphaerales bacterium]
MARDLSTRVFDSTLEMLPDADNPTPLVRLNRLVPAGSTLYAKLEWMNPFGSVKDRAAWEMLRDLEERGELGAARPGRGVVEPTSGNTGLSLAALAGLRGYGMRAVVPSKVPAEKKALLRMAGAEVDVVADAMCPLPGSEDGTIGLARSYARAQGAKYVMPNQYENQANAGAHERTTGPEIWRQTGGKVTHVFTALGTVGTATGLSRYLRQQNPDVKVIAVQPTPGHDVPGLRNVSELGVSRLFDPALIDEILEVDFELAYVRAVELFRREGLRAGPSSGLIFEGARRVAERDGGRGVGLGVMIFCDDIFKYTSSVLKHQPGVRVEEPTG